MGPLKTNGLVTRHGLHSDLWVLMNLPNAPVNSATPTSNDRERSSGVRNTRTTRSTSGGFSIKSTP